MELNPNMTRVAQQPTIMFDTHAYVRHMRQGGFSEEQAETSADALTDAFRGAVVTQDVLKSELLICRDEFRSDIQEFRNEVRDEFKAVRGEIIKSENKLLIVLGGAIGASFIATTVLMISLKFWV